MTIATLICKNVYEADGIEDTFAYGFKIFAETDLVVYEDGVLSVLDYTVTDVGEDAGGTIVYTSTVPADGVFITLIRELPYNQGTDYTAYGPFPAETHEDTLDKLVMQIQQLKEIVDRCIKLPNWNETDPVEIEMSPGDDVSSTTIGFDVSGNLVLS